MKITYFIDDKLGGVASLNYNLIQHHEGDDAEHTVIQPDMRESIMTRANIDYPFSKNISFEYSRKENYYYAVKRLRQLCNLQEEGALILNYDTEMVMLDHYPTLKTTYQLVHDHYNVRLAKKYEQIVDVFICHNTVIYEDLRKALPHRTGQIFYQPHGVSIPTVKRKMKGEVLKLLFLGRMTPNKGIFDLPEISNLLRARGLNFEWVCIGNGPELERLRNCWNKADKLRFLQPESNAEVIALCAEQDVFVLPTKFEGSPVSLLETMSVGVVPVVSKIPGGITDIVHKDIGFVIDVDNNAGFAEAIEVLYKDRELLERLSRNCRECIKEKFDIEKTAAAYYNLFYQYKLFYREKRLKKLRIGARLDHPFIPSLITRFVRTLMN